MVSVAVHNGVFHADDVFAVAILKLIHKDVDVIRTRDEAVLATADIVADVGGIYDHAVCRYDHHQQGGAGRRNNGIEYAAAGLVWKHYGMQLCEEAAWKHIDERLIQGIDAMDNGYMPWEPKQIAPFTMHEFVQTFLPNWQDNPDFDERFLVAVDFAQQLLVRMIREQKGRTVAREMILEQLSVQSGPVLILDTYAPWKHTVITESNVLMVVFASTSSGWVAQCVPKDTGTFELRVELPKEWRGLTGTDLVTVTGVSDARFCHKAGFMCVAESKEGAVALAQKALSMQ